MFIETKITKKKHIVNQPFQITLNLRGESIFTYFTEKSTHKLSRLIQFINNEN